MPGATELIQECFQTEERGVDWRSGVAGAIAAVGPLAIGLAIDEPEAGFTAALGGLNAALVVPRADLRARLWWGIVALLGQTVAVLVASAVADSDVLVVAITVAWVAGWAFFRAVGPTGALLGFATAAVFVIMVGIPSSAPVEERVWWAVLGGVPGFLLMVAVRGGHGASIPSGGEALRKVRDAVLHDRSLQGHALRLALTVGGGTLLYIVLGLKHGYWVPLTTLAILQPSEHGTRVRSVQRTAGTLAGAGMIIAVVLVTDARWPLIACAAAAAFALYALHERGYFWLVVLLTPTVLLMISAVDFEGDDVALDRIANSLVGIVLGLAVAELAYHLGKRSPRSTGIP